MSASEFRSLTISTGEPAVREYAGRLLTGLAQRFDMAKATAILHVALLDAFLAVLHAEAPMPETNIATMRSLIANLNDTIDEHEECAINAQRGPKEATPRVH